jgi:diguanylate cyclase (GGDEF)-like protein
MKHISKLQQQIFGIATILAMFIILLLGITISIVLYNQGIQNAEAVLQNKNKTVTTLIQGYFAPLRKAVEYAAGDGTGIDHGRFQEAETRQAILNMYTFLQNTIPNINFVYSGYEDGSLLINNYTPPKGFDSVQRPWYQAAIQAHPLASDGIPYQDIITKEWLVSIGKTMTDQNRQAVGVLAIDASMDTVVQALSARDDAYPTAHNYVLDNQGIVLIHNDPTLPGTFHEKVFQSLPPAEISEGNFSYQVADTHTIAHFSRLDDLGWIVITGVPRADILRPILVTIFSSLGIIIAVSLIATWLVSFLLSRKIINPLIHLQKRVQEIADGRKASISSDFLPNNEIGTIAEAIETLTEDALFQKTIELQTKNSLLDSLSKTDQLTGIANRRRTQQVIEQEIDRFNRYKKPFCILLFDIDHFKTVNDTHGHEVGDQVLVELAGLVQSVVRRTDTFGRWGGEEFILVCPETPLHKAQTIAGKICTIVRDHEFAQGLGVTLSIGVSEFQNGTTLKEILSEVDRKMYLAKQKGRDRVEA